MLKELGTSQRDIEDEKMIKSMIGSTTDIIEWIETGVNPYYQQGIDVNNAYHIQHLSNMDIIPDLTERMTAEREPLDITDEWIEKVERAIWEVLTDRERDCLLLHVAKNMSMSEVADQLLLSKSSVQTYVNRAKEKIKEM